MSKSTTVTLNRIAVLRRRGNHGTPELVTTYETQHDANLRIREEQNRKLVDMSYFTVALSGTYQQPLAPYAAPVNPAPVAVAADSYTVTNGDGTVYGTHSTHDAACTQRDRLAQAAPNMKFSVNKVTIASTPANCPPASKFQVMRRGDVVKTTESYDDAKRWIRYSASYDSSQYSIIELVPRS